MKVISLSGIVGWDFTPGSIRTELNETKGDIRVDISSPGGLVYSGIAISNLFRNYDKGSVTMRIVGMAASMASYIALAGDKVEAHSDAVYMIHNPMNGMIGNYIEMRKNADYLEQLSNHMAKTYSAKSGKSTSEIKSLFDKETYFFGNEMQEAGFVDEIIEIDNKNNDKDSAILNAMVELEDCNTKLKESDKSKDDLQKAAACINLPNISTPQNQNQNPQEKKTMAKLKDLFNENPEAKDEHEKIVSDAVSDAVTAANEALKAKTAKAVGFMVPVYGKLVNKAALDVIKGETEMTVLEAMAGMVDVEAEQEKIDLAAKETEELGETNPLKPKGDPTAEEAYQARKIELTGGQ